MPLPFFGNIQSSDTSSIAAVCATLDDTFSCLDSWCHIPEERLIHRPSYPHAWTALEHLEHVSLVNHFLLLTIGKGVNTALRRARTQPIPVGESDLMCLAPIADPDAFPWEPPGHMIPSGTKTLPEIREFLKTQHRQCREMLERIGKGEGKLCSFRMSVFSLGRLDMYQWLFFLAQHGRWHLEFLARRERQQQQHCCTSVCLAVE
jgi:hypothetical protein